MIPHIFVLILLAYAALEAAPPRQDQPGEAMQYYLDKRVIPGERHLPMDRYVRARDRARRMPLYSSRTRRLVASTKDSERNASIGKWTPLGPGNIGGRTRALLINPLDPAIMYTAGVAGGVWKSVDNGGSWYPLNDLLPSIAVSSMAMDPANPNIIYAGTGEGFNNSDAVRGAGIFKSIDAGESWQWLDATSTPDFYFVNKLVISHKDSRRVYAATSTGVFRSLDAGLTWTRHLDRRTPGIGCQDLALRFGSDDDVLFATCRATPTGGIWRNLQAHDSGLWEQVFSIDNMHRTSIAIAPSRPDTVYAMITSNEPGACPSNPGPNPVGPCYRNGVLGVYRSQRNGEKDSWEKRSGNSDENKINATLLSNPLAYFGDVCNGGVKTFSSQGWYDNALAVDPRDANRVWAGGIDIFRSDDGGANWGIASYWWANGSPQYAHADTHLLVFDPNYDGDVNQTMYATSDGGIYRTDNARAAVATGARAACTPSNGSVFWKSLNNNYSVTQFYHGSVYPGGHFYFAGAQDNGTTRGADVDGPNRWAAISGGDGGYTAINPIDPQNLFVETTRLSLRRSTDGGRTFRGSTSGITELSGNFAFIAPFIMDPSDPQRLYMGGRFVWRSTDNGATWSRASKEHTSTSSITALAVSPADPNRLLVATSDGRIFSTLDALTANAESDAAVTRPRNGNVSSLVWDPVNPEIAYATYSSFNGAASDKHIYMTENAGGTWRAIDGEGDTGIPDIPAHSLLPDPANPSTLYLGTDIGIFVSLDRGATWNREDSGFPYTVVESMSIIRNGEGSILYAFTHGRGAWRVWLGPGQPCTYKLSPATITFDRPGGTREITVDTPAGCGWSVLNNSTWATPDRYIGTGPGVVRLEAPTTVLVRRESSLIIADQFLNLLQQ
jgi:hypothetical protein